MVELNNKVSTFICLIAASFVLMQCSDNEGKLPGKRFGLDVSLETSERIEAGEQIKLKETEGSNLKLSISIPKQQNNLSWTHRNGNSKHKISHPYLSESPKLIWKARIGKGNSSKYRITSDPIVVNDEIYVLNSRSTVLKVTSEGSIKWKTKLTPPFDSEADTSAGGLAFGAKKVFVSTGFGELFAISPVDGDVIWRQRFKAPINAAPTIIGDQVFVMTANGQAFALDVEVGRIQWQQQSTLASAILLGGSSVTEFGNLALLPFDSGELTAVLKESGVRIWSASVASTRKGSARSNINNVTSDPVVFDGIIYTANQGGRLVALDSKTGGRIWTNKNGSYSPIWAVDDSVFIMTDLAELKRLNKDTGEQIWATSLPQYPNIKKRNKSYAHYGPILAGGKLWVTSSDGFLRSFELTSGDLLNKIRVPSGAASHMAIVDGVLYMLSQNGQLLAYK